LVNEPSTSSSPIDHITKLMEEQHLAIQELIKSQPFINQRLSTLESEKPRPIQQEKPNFFPLRKPGFTYAPKQQNREESKAPIPQALPIIDPYWCEGCQVSHLDRMCPLVKQDHDTSDEPNDVNMVDFIGEVELPKQPRSFNIPVEDLNQIKSQSLRKEDAIAMNRDKPIQVYQRKKNPNHSSSNQPSPSLSSSTPSPQVNDDFDLEIDIGVLKKMNFSMSFIQLLKIPNAFKRIQNFIL